MWFWQERAIIALGLHLFRGTLQVAQSWVNRLSAAGNFRQERLSQLQGRIAFSNSLVNTMDMTVAIQYILTAAQSLGSQVYYKKSRMTILGLAGVLYCENEQA